MLQAAGGGEEGMSSDGDRSTYGAIGALGKWHISNPWPKAVRGMMSYGLMSC